MPQIIKKVSGYVLNQIIGDVAYVTISGQLPQGNCGSFYGFYGFLQDFTETKNLINLNKPINFGLNNNMAAITLEITY